jgi:tetratricopeptide (TPR) repeat protein
MSVFYWALGTGLETFGNSFPAWQSKELARQYPDFYHESPHNLFLDALTSQGVAGLLIWLGLCGLPLIYVRKDPALGAGFLAVLVSVQFTSLTIATATSLLFLAAALVRGRDENPSVEIARRWRLIPCIVGSAFVLAGLVTVVTDQRLQAVKNAFDAGRTDDATSAHRQARRWALAGGSADLYYSRQMAALGRWPEALEAARRAVQTAEDRQNAWYSLATVQASANDAAGVEASLKGAIAVAPNWFKPHWMLAQVLDSQGRIDEAEREGELALDLGGSRFPEVTESIEKIRPPRAKPR